MALALMPVIVAGLNVAGGLCLAFSFKASAEAAGLSRLFSWGYGSAVRFNRGLFWVGVGLMVAGGVVGAFA